MNFSKITNGRLPWRGISVSKVMDRFKCDSLSAYLCSTVRVSAIICDLSKMLPKYEIQNRPNPLEITTTFVTFLHPCVYCYSHNMFTVQVFKWIYVAVFVWIKMFYGSCNMPCELVLVSQTDVSVINASICNKIVRLFLFFIFILIKTRIILSAPDITNIHLFPANGFLCDHWIKLIHVE